MSTLSLEQAERISSRFLHRYTDCLDSGRYAEWPTCFHALDCRYEIRSRENEDLGLPAAIMYCDTHGMMVDRVTMLDKALTYRRMILRHFVSNVLVRQHSEKSLSAIANYQLMQTDNDGVTNLFGVGQYQMELIAVGDDWFASKLIVVADTFGIDNMLAVPI
jgi:anthranilate 1,2-dioxygenase small subunit